MGARPVNAGKGSAPGSWKLKPEYASLTQGLAVSPFGHLHAAQALFLQLPKGVGGGWLQALRATLDISRRHRQPRGRFRRRDRLHLDRACGDEPASGSACQLFHAVLRGHAPGRSAAAAERRSGAGHGHRRRRALERQDARYPPRQAGAADADHRPWRAAGLRARRGGAGRAAGASQGAAGGTADRNQSRARLVLARRRVGHRARTFRFCRRHVAAGADGYRDHRRRWDRSPAPLAWRAGRRDSARPPQCPPRAGARPDRGASRCGYRCGLDPGIGAETGRRAERFPESRPQRQLSGDPRTASGGARILEFARSGGSEISRPGVDAKWIAERIVGRTLDGDPLQPDGFIAPQAGLPANDFGYAHTDVQGFGCPLGAHIRRANPRDSLPSRDGATPDLAVAETLLSAANAHRILRRGRKFGPDLADPRRADGEERGLMFMCLNTDLVRQFEFVQQTWMLNQSFATLFDETDPLLGPPGRMTIPACPLRLRPEVQTYVQMAGGEYFFLPSLPALAYLGGLEPSPPRS